MPLYQSIAEELDASDNDGIANRVVLLDNHDHATLKQALTELNMIIRPDEISDDYAAHDISWMRLYDDGFPDERWVIVISDITTFSADVLRDLILILR